MSSSRKRDRAVSPRGVSAWRTNVASFRASTCRQSANVQHIWMCTSREPQCELMRSHPKEVQRCTLAFNLVHEYKPATRDAILQVLFLQSSPNDLGIGRRYLNGLCILLPSTSLFGDDFKEQHFLTIIQAMPLLLFGSSGCHQKMHRARVQTR